MGILKDLQPRRVFDYFEALCAIPHGSGNTAAVSDWCVQFAKDHGLEHYQDAAGNVIIVKEASPGYEQAPAVILQGHMDMVCEKTPECAKDMEKEGLDLRTDGVSLWAEGTTLGGDDGIAVAMMMAILEDDALPHPRLEAVFTVDEEIGMLGAEALDATPLTGRTLLNLDSEDEGIFTVSCAGGNRTLCRLPVRREACAGTALTVRVRGLIGGHSGVEIHKGRANADLLLGRVLLAMADGAELRLVSAEGGLKDNAIPVEATAVVVTADARAATAAAERMSEAFRQEFCTADPGITVEVLPAVNGRLPMDRESTEKVLCMLTCVPNGVQVMSLDIPGLVQTSLNLGILRTEEGEVSAEFCVRSSVESEKAMLKRRLRCLLEALGGTVEYSGDYPGWAYRQDSPLRERMVGLFREQYGKEPHVEAIHAGVECGLFAGKLPGLDCVSIGPDLREIHTPREVLDVASAARVYAFVVELLRRWK